MLRWAIGVDLGGTKVEACLVDGARQVLARKRRPSEPGLGRERVVANILELVAETAGGAPFEAVGLGTPGTYSAADDIMYGAPHTPLYEKPGLISLLRSKLGAPLVVENDANCLALAEYFAQCHGRFTTVMAVILGTGMGSGLILGGRLHRGPQRQRRRDRPHFDRHRRPSLRMRPSGMRRGLSLRPESRSPLRRARG